MKVYELKVNDVINNGEMIIKVLGIWYDEMTIFIQGPDTYRIERGYTDDVMTRINAMFNTPDDFDSREEFDESQRTYWSSEHPEVRLISARPEDKDFDPTADYCMHDTEYMLDCETGELYDL